MHKQNSRYPFAPAVIPGLIVVFFARLWGGSAQGGVKLLVLLFVSAAFGFIARYVCREEMPESLRRLLFRGDFGFSVQRLLARLFNSEAAPLVGLLNALLIFFLGVLWGLSGTLFFFLLIYLSYLFGAGCGRLHDYIRNFFHTLSYASGTDKRRAEQSAAGDQQGADAGQTGETQPGGGNRERFVELLVRILVWVAQADGHFTRAELEVILNFFRKRLNYDERRLGRIKRMAKHAMDNPQSLDSLLDAFHKQFDYPSHLILAALVFRLVHTKNPPLESELRLAHDIARKLAIFPGDLRTLEAEWSRQRGKSEGASGGDARQEQARDQRQEQARQQQYQQESRQQQQQRHKKRRALSPEDEDALAVLGLESNADFAAIKKRYRRMVLQYHPDRVSHLGEEFKKVAEEKMKAINAAYGHLERRFGK